ncbi:hypothetical protein [Microbacterium lacticum]|uniref:hypothetical protein n=1 Tax=Microbacterium lacticum TaxID=33885 RepID=UPI001141F5CB|nr:hypothetical protein [Microbacterium lacticum]GEB94582.1 hypothetical protein MLA01_08010 [Microbacterium lacticum]GGN20504.1 hypothetical protein GCM10009724_13320 [Microbacterium lacticum]
MPGTAGDRHAAEILDYWMPPRTAKAYRRFRPGPAAFKVDLAVAEDVPWRDPEVGRAAIVAQIERFAPGFRERILALRVQSATQMSRENPNFVGGDILTGAKTPVQFLTGPRVSPFPYDTGVPGTYLCSAATPPGPGIHGTSGANAAERALRRLGVASA